MLLDIRLPIGLLFLATGVIVAARGLAPGALAATGLPIDLIWGSVMAVFGAAMLALALAARRSTSSSFPAGAKRSAGDR